MLMPAPPLPSIVSPCRQHDTLLSRRQIEASIAKGQCLVIFSGKVLKTDAWLDFHPGGDKVIKHMVGRDATDEIKALHSTQVQARMSAFQIGRIQGPWQNFVPPIQGGRFRLVHVQQDHDGNCEIVHEKQNNETLKCSYAASAPQVSPDCLRSRSSCPATTQPCSATNRECSDTSLCDRTKQELDFDLAKYPPLDPAIQDCIVQKYRLLEEQVQAQGLYQCNYLAYIVEICRYTLLFSTSMLLLRCGWYGASGVFLGMFWHQLVFTAHDAGHIAITHNYKADTIIGIIIADFLGGLSLGWWKRSHYIHHIVTNSPEHDPDIELMPFFLVSHRFFTSLRSTYYDRQMHYDAWAKFLVRYQHYLYYPILAFGRFNLYFLSWEHLIRGLGPRKGAAHWHRWLEILGHLFFWLWFGYGLVYKSIPTLAGRAAFIMLSHVVTMPLHVQITLSHYAMSTADLGATESFPQKMLRTTMDVDCPHWLDFFHGGLQFQAVHHLFPRIPRHNLRAAQKLVQAFCNEVGIPYALYGFAEGNGMVVGRLQEIGKQARLLADCQKSAAKNILLH